ncbi:SMP-30/gluconolactonase/LRE family protein [Paenibacillus melissococcoides]|uniref:SMP-30/gluconolactonase/LRE family protein n=1 Tax=Paenibacillus melissococcoides TaxID=2912268 RepID=A0ABM9FXE3_9BACL|nr:MULTISPECIES: SMP-30/gluconolactonase/LRE family protein [Paenibacillus]MEB9897013.1 SMP-30/gluconolactonase/LRE family protein [Bacillus cereus]CAH8243868.1 SMP-30/gluconolactonase/LRE family protein [Paenibacillus melissococcoides]CAH8704358.1 SMP-30/gluconolactonase/LRE family protein [Paenibacillus melissococcoides]CAH8707129.1 SMP-30/gluconolactonase/LRE family protein [Paenibacillus melissococcoides]GIO77362.1 gluconolactonase [Paenibacillus dendritiformis]
MSVKDLGRGRRSEQFTPPNGFTGGVEGPACDKDGNLYAVNYEREGTIGKVTPEGVSSVFLELPEGSIANGIRFNRAGDMFMADYTRHRIYRYSWQERRLDVLAEEPAMNQPNDIAISSRDVLFASDPNWADDTGQLWRIDPDGKTTRLEAGMGTTNGIEVSPDDRLLYVNESVQRRIWVYDLAGDGNVSNKRLFHEFPDYGLDGMRCDVEGYLYVTRFGKGTVVILSPAGELVEEVQLLGKECTNLTFGGEDGRTVYVTIKDKGNIERFVADRPGRCRRLFGLV